MTTVNYNESENIEREKANLLFLIKLTLKSLIDQSSATTPALILDDRHSDVTNFIITLERILSFRMRATWLSDRRYFWEFMRPACIGSCRQTIVERVEELSQTRSLKDKGRAWIKIALMEKKLSELLKLVISDAQLVRKFYYDDSIITSSQAFILCDQLAGLNAIDFSFCFKQDALIIAPILLNDSEIDVIDLTPFLSYKSKQIKQCLNNKTSNEENIESSRQVNHSENQNSSHNQMVPLDKYKLEIEQRKYFEELLQHRDQELQQMKIRYEILKGEREKEILQMENIILELQHELRTVRDEAESKRKKSQLSESLSPPKTIVNSNDQKSNSPSHSIENIQMFSSDSSSTNTNNEYPYSIVKTSNDEKRSNDFINPSSQLSNYSNIDDEQYELVRPMAVNMKDNSNQMANEIKPISSPEMISSATSLSTPTSSLSFSNGDDEEHTQTITATPEQTKSIDNDPIESNSNK